MAGAICTTVNQGWLRQKARGRRCSCWWLRQLGPVQANKQLKCKNSQPSRQSTNTALKLEMWQDTERGSEAVWYFNSAWPSLSLTAVPGSSAAQEWDVRLRNRGWRQISIFWARIEKCHSGDYRVTSGLFFLISISENKIKLLSIATSISSLLLCSRLSSGHWVCWCLSATLLYTIWGTCLRTT